MEEWKPVYGFEEQYEVSSAGRVRSLDREIHTSNGHVRKLSGRVLALGPHPRGYFTVQLGFKNYRLVHRLVCEAFYGPAPYDKPLALHADDDPQNNQVENLRWGSPSDNMFDREANGNGSSFYGIKEKCMRGHLFASANLIITPGSGRRRCRSCEKEGARARYAGVGFDTARANAYYEEIMRSGT